ncbi:outer membrane lipoprotein chaperone LolA [Pelagibaculum spongiae]|uniref:Outer-membrane lipoprotein carrier protein n=1 Tax=Pelagibaculum spongiae TaxID=2080658 RepID=A0A2V1GYI2_9GAMM|nr:outer membrane lipoprotein chaperone LolA [Pelagibaculum spongiae]PVZ71489.1 outer membrane lipoprotein carrier protein LolA [Pelagibaculum spongiae]
MRSKLWICLLAFWLPVTAFAGDADQLKAWLAKVDQLQASFDQQTRLENGQLAGSQQGRFWLRQPSKFRWQVDVPDEQVIIADGRKLWNYDPLLEQVIVQDQFAVLSQTPAMILSNRGTQLEQHFKVEAEADDWLKLTPLKENSPFEIIRLRLDSKKGLTDMVLFDQLGSETRIRFVDLEINPSIDPAKFRFTAPEGVDLIEQ